MLPLSRGALAEGTGAGSLSFAAATRLLEQARAEAARSCTHPTDVLVGIVCEKRLRVGLRGYYPGFSVRGENGVFTGFEPDIARRIAAFLGVSLVPVLVDPKSRIPMLAGGQVDLVIATMGHTAERGAEVSVIRPHYYVSQTAVVGAVNAAVTDWDDLGGRTVCLPLGASSNIIFARHNVRILTFDRPEQLLDALRFHKCAFIVHDDTFFAEALTDHAWSSQFGIKFRFAPLPWGMAVAREGAGQFAALLEYLSVAFHADGVFLQLAAANRVDLSFLEAEHQRWADSSCVAANGAPLGNCLVPPVDNARPADTSYVAQPATWLEHAAAGWFGVKIDLSVFKNRDTFGLVLEGIGYSLALIVGTLISTTICALGFGRLMVAGPVPVRRGVRALTAFFQVTPLPLLMFFAYVVAGGIAHYTGTIALAAAVSAIGLYNGSNAARAIDDAHQTLLRLAISIRGPKSAGKRRSFFRAVSLADVQLVAFLINAAKGSPAAGMIGVPEFLNVITDLTADSRDRMTMYLMLLLFYVSLVLIVIWLLSALRSRLQSRARHS
jgi:ABC-type amino acid transport substrate-binding protein/ABC-type amino acid transport system permease subunit